MIKDEFTKTNGLDYEKDCDVDLENDDGDYFGNVLYFTSAKFF